MKPPQRPGEKPATPGKYKEVGPRHGEVPNPRHIHIDPSDPKLPPTQKPGRGWDPDGPRKP